MPTPIYCTYLTIYSGNKLPPFYIGSTDTQKVANNYHGSVTSKKYKTLWMSEIKANPKLFTTKILTTHNTREEATDRERKFQIQLNVVSSPLYINEALASPTGFFGKRTKGKDHHRYGVPRPPESEETRKRRSESHKGKPTWNKGKTYTRGPNTQETNMKISISRTGKTAGNKHPLYGKSTSDLQKARTAEKNCKRYEILFEDGTTKIIHNMSSFCKERGISAVVFGRYNNKLDRPYHGMRFRKLS